MTDHAKRNQSLSAAKLALAVRNIREHSPESSLLASDPIAIVGIGCRFPGGANSAEQYWQFLKAGKSGITKIPPERWSADAFFDADPQQPGKTNSRFGGFISGADQFDPFLFGIAPREAASMDPQQRLLLEVAWESLWDSGRAPQSLAGSSTGIFVAIYNSDYSRLLYEDPASIGPNTSAGSSHSIASGRLSFLLDLRGPSISIDTACSSSLVAVHLACQSLRARECQLALAGGVTLHLLPEHYIAMAKLGMLSAEGLCKTFDAAADGFVPGEGCGVIVLRPLVDALRDADHIYAVIRGAAVNQDGRTNVLTAPNGLAQQAVIRAALHNAQVSPASISYVETHGTGTALGDPIEVEALKAALSDHDAVNAAITAIVPAENTCVLGAVKTNFGHLEAAAGVAGLIKAALALEHQEIPRNLHYKKLNPHIELEGTRFALATKDTAWPRSKNPRFAGVSSFGFGGTNAHIILEEAPQFQKSQQTGAEQPDSNFIIPISARTPKALRDFALSYKTYLHDATNDVPLSHIASSAATRRDHYEYRLAVVADSKPQASTALTQFLAGQRAPGVIAQSAPSVDTGVVFVCSGQGSQWPRMGVSLFKRLPAFFSVIEKCDYLIRALAKWSLIDELNADEAHSRLDHTEFAQPAIFAIEVALARLWESWEIVPAALIGHSAGEVAAAHIGGALSLEEAIRIVVNRGRLMEPTKGCGKMLAVRLAAEKISSQIAEYENKVSIAAINSPISTVVSGDSDAIEKLAAAWHSAGIACRLMPVDYAFHSEQMESLSKELARMLGRIETHASHIPIVSTVQGAVISGAQFDAQYWAQNMRQPVKFAAAVDAALRMDLHTFLEVGPHPVLLSYVEECLGAGTKPDNLIPSLRRDRDELNSLHISLSRLYTLGAAVKWSAVYPDRRAPVSLPPYPYQRERFWIERKSAIRPTLAGPKSQSTGASLPRGLRGTRVLSPAINGAAFETQLSTKTFPYLADHDIDGSLFFPMAAFLELARVAALEINHEENALTDVAITSPLVLPPDGSRTVQVIVDGHNFKVFSLSAGIAAPSAPSAVPQWHLHAIGSIAASRSMTANANLRDQITAAHKPVALKEFYERLNNLGIRFGDSFRVLASLHASAIEAISEVRLSPNEEESASVYGTHPALLDGCLQAVLALLPPDRVGSYLPVGVDRFEQFKPAGHRVWCRARLNANQTFATSPNRALSALTANIEIFSESGEPVAVVAGLRLAKRTHSGANIEKLYRVSWKSVPRPQQHSRPAPANQDWLVVGDNLPATMKLAAAIRNLGHDATPLALGARLPASKSEISGVVLLLSSRSGQNPAEAATHHSTEALLLIQDLLNRFSHRPPRFCLVTHGAISAIPADSCESFAATSVWGFIRTVALEHPELHCLSIDADSTASELDFQALAKELCASPNDHIAEVALRGAERYTPRLEAFPLSEPGPRRLVLTKPGSVENLEMVTFQREDPKPGEVEVEVTASGLNFRDVLNVLGLHGEGAQSLGMEFCGRVARLGRHVTSLKAGDLVFGIAWGSFASYVNTPADLIARVPEHLNANVAAAIPNAFLTAYHSLCEIGRLKRGDKILIHAATGGVGLAAVHLAKHAGAEIWATAGSESKREYLRSLGISHVFSSRTVDFAREIKERTHGAGVDLVLNSLAGEFIEASLSVTGKNARFIEIGKTGIWTHEQVAAYNKNIGYHVVDLAPIIHSQPRKIAIYSQKLVALFNRQELQPLPVAVFSFDEAPEAFSLMAHAKHVGKIVIAQPAALRIVADASYVITGGMGGLGIELARHLISRGSRNLVLLGRDAPSPQAASAIREMQNCGARVETRSVDVSNRRALSLMLDEIKQKMPPLRGIIHAAGVLSDAVVTSQTVGNIHAAMEPKAHGAWNLHELTAGTRLDFFILFSSLASVTGSPGQSSYAAANAFLDGLAHYRYAHGLPALSIDWGAWAGVGMAARTEAQTHRRPIPGMHPMTVDASIAALDEAVARGLPQLVVADVDWTVWDPPPAIVGGLASSGTASLARANAQKAASPQTEIINQLQIAPTGNRRALLIQYLREQALLVLGLSDFHFIDERQPLAKMGLDSLMAVEFRNHLVADLGTLLPTTLLFDYPTLDALATLLGSAITWSNGAQRYASSGSAEVNQPSEDTLLATIDSLSDLEADELLKEELNRQP